MPKTNSLLLLFILSLCCSGCSAQLTRIGPPIVTISQICAAGGTSATEACSATGTPTPGGKAVIVFESYATVAATSSNVTCSDGSNSYVFQFGNPFPGSTYPNWSLLDTTLQTVASGMTFSCTSTQTGFVYGASINVFLVTNWSTGFDQALYLLTNYQGSVWATATLSASATGGASLAVVDTQTGSGCVPAHGCVEPTMFVRSTFPDWTGGIFLDSAALQEGPTMGAWLSNNPGGTQDLSMQFQCAASCVIAAGSSIIADYK